MLIQKRIEKRSGKPKILFIGEAVSLAHVGHPALLARWTQESAYEIAFACGTKFSQVATGQGLSPLALDTISPDLFYSRLRTGHFFYSQSELEHYIEQDRALIRREKPDLVVSDFRLSLPISTRLEGVRLLTLQQAHWSPVSEARFPAPADGPLGLLPRPLRSFLFNALRPAALRLFAAPLDNVRHRYGLPKRRDFRRNYTDGDYCAYLDLPELAPLPRPPRGHFLLGPLFWTPPCADASAQTESRKHTSSLKTDPALAYVSMGSSGDARVLPNVLRVLIKAGYSAVVSGSRQKLDAVDPRKVRYVGMVNPSSYLSRATLTVCHGGAGTVYQSLAAGVPVLSLPSNPDQEMMARAAERAGAGVCLPAESATATRLNSSLKQAESPSCREDATRLALAIKTHDTRKCWLAWLDATLAQTSIHIGEKAETSRGSLFYDDAHPLTSRQREPSVDLA